jgi:hypothetical protein
VQRHLPIWILLLLATACHGQASGVNQAEVIGQLHGTVLDARWHHSQCDEGSCLLSYDLRISNMLDRDAQVLRCTVDDGSGLELALNEGISGASIAAGQTEMVEGGRYLSIDAKEAKNLVGRIVVCDGLDWHGNPPF